MDPSVAMMLPKGIVINTTNIYKEVASYPTVPADKIWEYWHVYTITNKKLKDPTARRLENFWWQVWGSDRRHLSGRTLARLYEDISVGPTIAPLQGPPNRWEGPNAPPLTRQLILAHLSQERDARQPASEARPPPPQTKQSDSSVRSLSSSASKPPPPHPILKKSRGPSASGPRPTARFVSPHGSGDEDDKESDFPSSGSTVATGLEAPPVALPKKKPPHATKKFVAGTSSAKRRPLMQRRASPQSPVLSAVGSRNGDAPGSRTVGVARPVSPIPERASNHASPVAEGNGQPDGESPVPSAKALGKRPAVPQRLPTNSDGPGKARGVSSSSSLASSAHVAPRANLRPAPHAADSIADYKRRPGTPPLVSAAPVAEAAAAAPAMGRSQSHNGYGYERYTDRHGPNAKLFTGATASMTNVAAQGTIIDQSGSLPKSSILGESLDHSTTLPSRLSSSSLLDSRLTPTQPGTSASVPMARTRSQLTLLLEREKARTGDKPRSKN
ncbi:hypothetical protein JDV02_009904 [Purpureocillium takamizusanense]|uniref:Nitrogen regulatory protein areA GATA-like domain-containing protein n=1 Tax=Purpureocillium takamizusanense TaxID=2060973 RepID=A0A9Q8QRU4_9HYPO|nr:uncharacterized protein JDV02_009904 [Purpureocillium takamizusanense]UNI24131.1 hypothetical protein JDV02_009904 [Purpureocillium takamizusanense]